MCYSLERIVHERSLHDLSSDARCAICGVVNESCRLGLHDANETRPLKSGLPSVFVYLPWQQETNRRRDSRGGGTGAVINLKFIFSKYGSEERRRALSVLVSQSVVSFWMDTHSIIPVARTKGGGTKSICRAQNLDQDLSRNWFLIIKKIVSLTEQRVYYNRFIRSAASFQDNSKLYFISAHSNLIH